MKIKYFSLLILTMSLISFSAFSQSENEEPLLGLPGDNLDLYAVLDIFQKSKTIEDFEKSLNEESTGINNLDLNNDDQVDFIKVVTEKDGDDFLFILQDPISESEIQDVAVISVFKDESGKVFMQIIGDEGLYGKDYVIEPATETSPGVTANPAYTGDDPVTVNVAPTTEVIVVESTPVVKYVYSPAYVPYYPPYYYGYYPPYWRPIAVISIGIYRHNNWYHHHGGYHGGYHGGHASVHIHNHNTYNNYNNNKRNTSNTVNNNIKNGNFDTAGRGGTRPSTSQAGRGSNKASASNRASTKPSTSHAGRTKGGASTSNRAATSPSNRTTTSNRASTSPSNRASSSNRPSTSQASRTPSRSTSNRSSASRSSGASRSMGARGGGGRRR